MEDNFNKHLGNKLKLRRLALGLTQTKVAKAIKRARHLALIPYVADIAR